MGDAHVYYARVLGPFTRYSPDLSRALPLPPTLAHRALVQAKLGATRLATMSALVAPLGVLGWGPGIVCSRAPMWWSADLGSGSHAASLLLPRAARPLRAGSCTECPAGKYQGSTGQVRGVASARGRMH